MSYVRLEVPTRMTTETVLERKPAEVPTNIDEMLRGVEWFLDALDRMVELAAQRLGGEPYVPEDQNGVQRSIESLRHWFARNPGVSLAAWDAVKDTIKA